MFRPKQANWDSPIGKHGSWDTQCDPAATKPGQCTLASTCLGGSSCRTAHSRYSTVQPTLDLCQAHTRPVPTIVRHGHRVAHLSEFPDDVNSTGMLKTP